MANPLSIIGLSGLYLDLSVGPRSPYRATWCSGVSSRESPPSKEASTSVEEQAPKPRVRPSGVWTEEERKPRCLLQDRQRLGDDTREIVESQPPQAHLFKHAEGQKCEEWLTAGRALVGLSWL